MYSPRLGSFASRDPLETLNRYAYVGGNPVNDAVGELLSLINGYNYVGGNPVNRVDPTGMCPENPAPWDVFGWRCRFLAEGLAAKTNQPIQNFMWMDYGQLEALTALGTAADVTGGTRNFLDNALIVPDLFVQNPQIFLQALNEYLSGCGNNNIVLGSVTAPLSRSPHGVILILGGVALASAILGGYAALRQITQPSSGGIIYEYRLTGFDAKVGTLAEHLAKLLEHEVAGYPPSDPNPNRDPDGGWCRTIRRVIQEIDGAGYSERQLNRDLEAAGFAGDRWSQIISAVREVIKRGLCDDHWGDFGGGSLAAS
jgi:hypothetical protein